MCKPLATLIVLVLIDIRICEGVLNQRNHCPSWSYFDTAKQECNHTIDYAVSFLNNRTLLRVGYCATYDVDTGVVSFSPCPYFQSEGFVVHDTKFNIWYIELPDNISTSNDYMCGPLNRKGRVCSECSDGFGPSVTSKGFNVQCSNCTEVWYGIPLYLFMEFVPLTIFYVLILMFQINVTSAPMTCFIMYSQLVALWWSYAFNGEDFNVSRQMFVLNDHTEWFRKTLLAVYDIWNLRFFRFIVPPFCISNKLKPFHIGLLGYISIFYPLCLMILTKICIELLDRNCKPLIWLWRPFHLCFVRLRRGWNRKSDIIDVFATFFLLSFSKVLYQADLFMSYQTIRNKHYNNLSTLLGKSFVTNADLTVAYGSTEHLLYAIPAVLFMCVFNIIPTCRLDKLALKFFVDRFYACYRDGRKSFAGLYFVLRPMMFVTSSILSQMNISNMDPYLSRNILLTMAAILVALCRPYKEMYMNVLDTLLLVHFGLFCHLISSYQGFLFHNSFVITFETVLALPLAGFIVFIAQRAFQKTSGPYVVATLFQMCKLKCCNKTNMCRDKDSAGRHSSLSVQQPLLDPIHVRENDYEAIN